MKIIKMGQNIEFVIRTVRVVFHTNMVAVNSLLLALRHPNPHLRLKEEPIPIVALPRFERINKLDIIPPEDLRTVSASPRTNLCHV